MIGAVDETDCEQSPAQLEDIAFIAEQDGISLDEAIARYGWQTCLGEVTSSLSETYPDQYAGAAIGDDGRGAWIAFKGDVPQEVPDFLATIPVPVDLIGGRGFSEIELNETLQSVYADITSHGEVAAANGSYDIETGVITIHAQPLQTLTSPDDREQLRERLLPHQSANTAVAIDVVVVDELGGADESSDGKQGVSTMLSAVLLAAVLALAAGMLIRRRKVARNREAFESPADTDQQTSRARSGHMSQVEWFDRLMLALRARDVSGRQIGEILTELQTYVADSGTDPREEFGDPSDFADSLAGRSGPSRHTKVRFGIYVVVTCVGWLAVVGLMALGDDGSVPVPLSVLVASAILIAGMTPFFVWLVATAGPVLEGKQRPYPKLKMTLYWVIIGLAVFVAVSLPERPIFDIPGIVLWPIAFVAGSYLVVETILIGRHGRVRVPDQASPHGEDLVRRWTGIQGIKTGWRIGRSVHDD